jgi:hypothetical protein
LELKLDSTPFDADYVPASGTRLTTNFANLAKDPVGRSERIGITLGKMQERFDLLLGASGDASRHRLGLEIVTISIRFAEAGDWFPMTEMLRCRIRDRITLAERVGPTGCCYSSYVRDHDFNLVLPGLRSGDGTSGSMTAFGDLHGVLFRLQFRKNHPAGLLDEPVIIAISVAGGREYRRTPERHPMLGWRYGAADEESLTTRYFAKMGLRGSYFMPEGCQAPLAFYHEPDDLVQRSPEELAALISVMDVFERIYRPEIYSARNAAGATFLPSLSNSDFIPPPAYYDRVERDTRLGMEQALRARDEFLTPNRHALASLLSEYVPSSADVLRNPLAVEG